MAIGFLDLWETLGPMTNLFGVFGPLLAAVICLIGLRRPRTRRIVMVLGVAAMLVPVWFLSMVLLFMTGERVVETGTKLSAVFVTAPFAVGGGLAAALAWFGAPPRHLSRRALYILTGAGAFLIVTSWITARAFVEWSNVGEANIVGIGGWILGLLLP